MTLKQVLCGLSGHLWRPRSDDERLFVECYVCNLKSAGTTPDPKLVAR